MAGSKLSNEQKAEFRQAFDMFADGDGNIQNEKIKTLLKQIGQEASDAELDAMIREVDADGSGEIDFDEFCCMMASQLGLEDDEAKDAFKCLDHKFSAFVSMDDLKHIVNTMLREKLSADECSKIFKELDPDDTGKFNLEKFKKVFCF